MCVFKLVMNELAFSPGASDSDISVRCQSTDDLAPSQTKQTQQLSANLIKKFNKKSPMFSLKAWAEGSRSALGALGWSVAVECERKRRRNSPTLD